MKVGGWQALPASALRLGEVRAFTHRIGVRVVRLGELRDGRWRVSDSTALERFGKLDGEWLGPEAAVGAIQARGVFVPQWERA